MNISNNFPQYPPHPPLHSTLIPPREEQRLRWHPYYNHQQHHPHPNYYGQFAPPSFSFRQHHHQQQNRPQIIGWQQQMDNNDWSSQKLLRLLNESTKEKNNLEGQLQELRSKLEASEKGENETKIKLEKKTAELDEFLAKIEKKEGKMEGKLTQTDPIEFEHPLPLTNFTVDHHETIKRMNDLKKWEEKLNAREKKFNEEREDAIWQCRSQMEAKLTQMRLQMSVLSSRANSQEKYIDELKNRNMKIIEEMEIMKHETEQILLEENEKLKNQTNRCAKFEAELVAKNEEMDQIKKNHDNEKNNILFNAFEKGLQKNEEINQKLLEEIDKINAANKKNEDSFSKELALAHVENANLQMELAKMENLNRILKEELREKYVHRSQTRNQSNDIPIDASRRQRERLDSILAEKTNEMRNSLKAIGKKIPSSSKAQFKKMKKVICWDMNKMNNRENFFLLFIDFLPIIYGAWV